MEKTKESILETSSADQTSEKECVIFVDSEKGRVGIRMPKDEFFREVIWQVPLKDLMDLIRSTL